jgi:xylulose-5-phosphate/fructose-6-phosphate phosphoketolase
LPRHALLPLDSLQQALRAFPEDLKEEGTTTIPFDMAVLNDIDRFHLGAEVIDGVPKLGSVAAYAKQMIRGKLIEHEQYIHRHSDDVPEIRHWKRGGADE